MSDQSLKVCEISGSETSGYRFHGLLVSMIVHGLAMCGLLLASIRPWYFDSWAAREARALYVTAADFERDEAVEAEPVMISDSSQATGTMVRDKIDELADQARERSDPENLDRLDHLTKRLNEVSSQASIDRMSGALHTMLGTQARAVQPGEHPVVGEFDFDSAQFHDVRREALDHDAWRYRCVLIDAQGRVFEVEMSDEDGQRLYLTMQRIKQNPLLESVYRKIAMPLFDQMLNTARQTARVGSLVANEGESADSARSNGTGERPRPE